MSLSWHNVFSSKYKYICMTNIIWGWLCLYTLYRQIMYIVLLKPSGFYFKDVSPCHVYKGEPYSYKPSILSSWSLLEGNVFIHLVGAEWPKTGLTEQRWGSKSVKQWPHCAPIAVWWPNGTEQRISRTVELLGQKPPQFYSVPHKLTETPGKPASLSVAVLRPQSEQQQMWKQRQKRFI